MQEPTFKQHKLLESIKENGGSIWTTETEDLNLHWELVRGRYLKNLVCLPSGWRFDLTDEAEQYLSTVDGQRCEELYLTGEQVGAVEGCGIVPHDRKATRNCT